MLSSTPPSDFDSDSSKDDFTDSFEIEKSSTSIDLVSTLLWPL